MKKLNKLEVLASIENGNDDFRVTVETLESIGWDFTDIEDKSMELSIAFENRDGEVFGNIETFDPQLNWVDYGVVADDENQVIKGYNELINNEKLGGLKMLGIAEDNGFKIFEKDFSSQEQYEEWIEDNDLEISIHDAEIDDNTTDVVFRPRIEGISCQDLIIINFPGGYYERYKGME